MQRLTPFLLLSMSRVVSAADAPHFAIPDPAGATTPVIGTLRVTIAMFVVLAAVLAAAWLTRRLRGGSGAGNGSLQVISQVALGARERAVLLRVGAQHLLIGVAPGSVRTLHVLPESELQPGERSTVQEGDGDRPTVRAVLMRSLGK